MIHKGGAGECLAAAAAELIGSPFRLHGRDPATGLDCVGLVYASLLRIGRLPSAPQGYRLRNSDPSRWFAFAERSGLLAVSGAVAIGDVLMVEPGPGQQHLLIAESREIAIHAHAGVGRVVRQPIDFSHDAQSHWRLS